MKNFKIFFCRFFLILVILTVFIQQTIARKLFDRDSLLFHRKINYLGDIKFVVKNTRYQYFYPFIDLKMKDNFAFNKFVLPDRRNNFGIPAAGNSKLDTAIVKHKINWIKITALTAIAIGAGFSMHDYQIHAWWAGQREKFHVEWDWSYALSADKFGHFFTGGVINNTIKEGFEWAGVNPTLSIWIGSIFSIGWMTDIEIEDGHAREWGYSPGDEIFNLGGDIFAILRDLYKPISYFKVKWSYLPTQDPLHKGDFPDDYSGQTFWMTCSVYHFFPKYIKKFWPEWLNLAFGYGVKKYDDPPPDSRIQNFYLAPDINLAEIIPGKTKLLDILRNFIDNFKIIPMPALKWNFTDHNFQFVLHF